MPICDACHREVERVALCALIPLGRDARQAALCPACVENGRRHATDTGGVLIAGPFYTAAEIESAQPGGL